MLLYKEKLYLTPEMIQKALDPYLKAHLKQQLVEEKQVDFSYGIKGIGRFRFNVFYQRGTLRAVIRNIPFKLPTYDSLNMPDNIKQIATSTENGLILVTGATGNGKSFNPCGYA